MQHLKRGQSVPADSLVGAALISMRSSSTKDRFAIVPRMQAASEVPSIVVQTRLVREDDRMSPEDTCPDYLVAGREAGVEGCNLQGDSARRSGNAAKEEERQRSDMDNASGCSLRHGLTRVVEHMPRCRSHSLSCG